ncbi:cbb3-type cytochrome c oxidase subunit 3 [Aquisediminimonas profunda]|uniref:cbb3-type cytochrome c oxidase subunit 3 n=1 Tax=Aquisediminimonas profunda TaxID=1550733 RepID=UPI001C63A3E8|nr:cbb3-type cytochrome c oxidase subunit 3 [Aquisediminimonas profunda]
MTYDSFRHFADSWGLVFMGLLFVTFIGWTFRKGASTHHSDAAAIIFKDEDHG